MRPRKTLGLALVGLATLALTAAPIRADVSCSPFGPDGLQRCVAGLRSHLAAGIEAMQKKSQWCWAAAIQMVLRQHGYDLAQKDIVRAVWGGEVNQPGTAHQILAALNREWTDRRGKRFRVSGDVYSANPITAAQDLAQNLPLILGTQGHAVVLTALEYVRAPNGAGNVTLATVRDPWPGRGRRHLAPNEWYQTMLLVRIRTTPIGGHPDHGPAGPIPPTCRPVTEPCQHPAHPQGDLSPCTHPAHPNGDLVPCTHVCPTQWGPRPCHPQGDLVPCTHPAHPMGDLTPCTHPAHPGGHTRHVCQ